MKTVVVTGGMGSGKSAVCRILGERGIPVYDSDARTKALYNELPDLIPTLEKALDLSLRLPDGALDKSKLAARIFSDQSARETLESIVYPLVKEDFLAWRSRQKDVPFVVLESAVVLSKPLFADVIDAVVQVEAPDEVRVRRVMDRDGLSREQILGRLAAQPAVRASVVIENAGSLSELENAVDQAFFRQKCLSL